MACFVVFTVFLCFFGPLNTLGLDIYAPITLMIGLDSSNQDEQDSTHDDITTHHMWLIHNSADDARPRKGSQHDEAHFYYEPNHAHYDDELMMRLITISSHHNEAPPIIVRLLDGLWRVREEPIKKSLVSNIISLLRILSYSHFQKA